jgi:hypothetical protein
MAAAGGASQLLSESLSTSQHNYLAPLATNSKMLASPASAYCLLMGAEERQYAAA